MAILFGNSPGSSLLAGLFTFYRLQRNQACVNRLLWENNGRWPASRVSSTLETTQLLGGGRMMALSSLIRLCYDVILTHGTTGRHSKAHWTNERGASVTEGYIRAALATTASLRDRQSGSEFVREAQRFLSLSYCLLSECPHRSRPLSTLRIQA